jgi:hypothetical protein
MAHACCVRTHPYSSTIRVCCGSPVRNQTSQGTSSPGVEVEVAGSVEPERRSRFQDRDRSPDDQNSRCQCQTRDFPTHCDPPVAPLADVGVVMPVGSSNEASSRVSAARIGTHRAREIRWPQVAPSGVEEASTKTCSSVSEGRHQQYGQARRFSSGLQEAAAIIIPPQRSGHVARRRRPRPLRRGIAVVMPGRRHRWRGHIPHPADYAA